MIVFCSKSPKSLINSLFKIEKQLIDRQTYRFEINLFGLILFLFFTDNKTMAIWFLWFKFSSQKRYEHNIQILLILVSYNT